MSERNETFKEVERLLREQADLDAGKLPPGEIEKIRQLVVQMYRSMGMAVCTEKDFVNPELEKLIQGEG